MRVLIVGCGYVGLPLGAKLVQDGHEVFGLRRQASDESELLQAGIRPLYADISNRTQVMQLPGDFDWVVNCAASKGGDLLDYRQTYLEGTRNLLEWMTGSRVAKYIYTSSTSVYGQNDGSVVSEADAALPDSETGKVLRSAEELLLTAFAERQFPAVILRLAGIYGPGRGYWLRLFLRGEARLEGSGGRWLNMIHRDDVIGATVVALDSAVSGRIYNIADNEPVTQRTVFEWLAQRFETAMPPTVAEGAEVRKRGVTNKRISNERLRRELNFELRYPTFREGYEAEISRLSSEEISRFRTTRQSR